MNKERESIAEKTKKLNQLMAWFDGDDFSLEEAVDKYAEATKLASEIEGLLKSLKNKITKIDTNVAKRLEEE
ncbi:exodeoxyribonuclease VII small subunit [Candidatus Saccharibacteria bacterium]|nr:exodeoxyribonuclease VII small subunit [Candidatus Saccharibacteria bacterium]